MIKAPKKTMGADVAAALSGMGAAKETLRAPTRGRPDRPYVSQTFFVPRETHGRLKELAAKRNISVQMLLAEAVDAWLAEQGEPPFFPAGWKGWKV
ncbi:MAG: ribbon-helix-helix domain-containing protein [Rhodomicrobium sp.]